MAIKIIEDEGPDVYLTAAEHARLMTEYRQAFMFYAGIPPSFERWVKGKESGYSGSGDGVTFADLAR